MYNVERRKHFSQARKLLMAAWHQREARFALRYQTHLTVVRLIGISRVDCRGAGVSACLIMLRLACYPYT